MKGNVPEWLTELQKKTTFEPGELTTKSYIYFQLNNGLIIKIDNDDGMAYRFNDRTQEWNRDLGLYAEYSYGNLRGQEISFVDSFPEGPSVEEVRGRHF